MGLFHCASRPPSTARGTIKSYRSTADQMPHGERRSDSTLIVIYRHETPDAARRPGDSANVKAVHHTPSPFVGSTQRGSMCARYGAVGVMGSGREGGRVQEHARSRRVVFVSGPGLDSDSLLDHRPNHSPTNPFFLPHVRSLYKPTTRKPSVCTPPLAPPPSPSL